MAQYSPEFLASLQHRYEKTDQPMIELAREFGIGITTLQVLVDKHAFEKRSQRLRGLPRAARLEREAEALAAQMGASPTATLQATPTPPLPLSGGGSNAVHPEEPCHTLASPPPERGRSIAERSEGNRVEVIRDEIESQKATPTPPLPLSRGGSIGAEPSPVERLEALVVQEIADLESAREIRGGKRLSGAGAERTAQALASLTRTLQAIRRMRGEYAAMSDRYDPPEDIDAQRDALAHRIEALVAEWLADDARAEREAAAVHDAAAAGAPSD